MTDQPRLFSRPLEFVGARRAAVVAEQLEAYREFQPVASDTYFNYRERIFRSAGVTLRTSPLGSFGTDGSWVWAWADDQTCPPGSPERELSLRLRQLGERIGAPELVTPRLDLTIFPNPRMMAERLAVISMGALAMPGYAVTVMPTGARQFSMIEDESVPTAPCPLPHLMHARLTSATEIFPIAPHETAIEYLRHHSFLVVVPDGTSVVATREPGWVIRLGFDQDSGQLVRWEVTDPNSPPGHDDQDSAVSGSTPLPADLPDADGEGGKASRDVPAVLMAPAVPDLSVPDPVDSFDAVTPAAPEGVDPEQADPAPVAAAESVAPVVADALPPAPEDQAKLASAEPNSEQRAYLKELTELINDIGLRLERSLPGGWDEFRFDFSGTVSAGTLSLRATLPTGEVESHEIPDDVMPMVMDLRARMYSKVAGTWFGLTITSTRPGRYSVDFNNDTEPDSPTIKPEDYVRDLQRFPRAPDRTPDWLRRKIQHAQPVQ